MQRRDLSKILLASTATSALAMRSVQAQTCTAPCYTRTPAEVTAGVTPTNLAYPQGDVRRYGADPTGSADSTTAVQNALNVGQAVYLAAGNYKITAALTNGVSNRRIYGDGPAVSVLQPKGAINTFVNTAPLSCMQMDNLGIFTADPTTLGSPRHPARPSSRAGSKTSRSMLVVGRSIFRRNSIPSSSIANAALSTTTYSSSMAEILRCSKAATRIRFQPGVMDIGSTQSPISIRARESIRQRVVGIGVCLARRQSLETRLTPTTA
jgi:hypothetical protein